MSVTITACYMCKMMHIKISVTPVKPLAMRKARVKSLVKYCGTFKATKGCRHMRRKQADAFPYPFHNWSHGSSM
jgi:hypothetical protein